MDSKTFQKYLSLVFSSYALCFILRVFETILIFKNIGAQEHLFRSEIAGVLNDVLLVNTLLLILYVPYSFLSRLFKRSIIVPFAAVLVLLGIIHLLIVIYFTYQLQPLDIFLFQYSFKEIWYTITTSDISLIPVFLFAIFLIVVFIVLYFLIRRIHFSPVFLKGMSIWGLVSFVCIAILPNNGLGNNLFSTNKSFYFFKKAFASLNEQNGNEIDGETIAEFRKTIGWKSYISNEFPLLHHFQDNDVLGPFLKKASQPPNFVFIVVEGLNDDFIHSYRGVHLMPFVEQLRDSGLYWERAFTLGERSFAVMPSSLGSLPYGEKGFTLLDKYPLHLTLGSVLRANNYYTSFFYNQASWFHHNGHFFRENFVNLIFDNSNFSPKYHKIIVGDDNFFWGYHDKDFFRQASEVLDTLTDKSQFDVMYTGTMHSPFYTPEEAYYDSLYQQKVAKVFSVKDKGFLNQYQKYLRTTLVTDDALKNFIDSWKKRKGFDRTIFIITGDHPMTEVPRGNSLKRYHVPIIIYSPLVKTSKVFRSVVSHLDIYETILGYLSKNYGIKVPQVSAALGGKLDTSQQISMRKSLAFMNDNREVIDFYSNGRYISNGNGFFKVDERLNLTPIENDKANFNRMNRELSAFKAVSLTVSTENKLVPRDAYLKALRFQSVKSMSERNVKFNDEYHTILKKVPISNRHLMFEIKWDSLSCAEMDGPIVYQLTNQNDSTVLWKTIKWKQKLNELVPLEKTSLSDTTLYFDAYFWNRKKQSLSIEGLKATLYKNITF